MPWTRTNSNPPLDGIQRSDSFRDKYINLLRTAQDVHMIANGSYETSDDEFYESVEVLRLKLENWVDGELCGTQEADLSQKFDNAVKQVIQTALDQADLYQMNRIAEIEARK